jgi:biopolymer transport protein ExbD/biopolymer transport protein TolR
VNLRLQSSNSLRRLICRIDVTALAAILFVLVTAFAVHPVADLPMDVTDSPKVAHAVAIPAALREDMMEVAVTRDGSIWFQHERFAADRLPQAIREQLSHGAERKVYIRADSRARYGTVIQVLNGVRSAGVENVAFLVDQKPNRD